MQWLTGVRRLIKLNIRSKLLLVSLALLIIPFVGYQYIAQMENYLRGEQEKSLLENARVVAAVFQSYPNIFNPSTEQIDNATDQHHLYIRPLKSPIQMDGYAEDWTYYRDRTLVYSSVKAVPDSGKKLTQQFSYRFQAGNYRRYLYALFQIKDKHIVYRQANNNSLDKNDYLEIALVDHKNKLHHYIIATHSPGRVSAYEVIPARKRDEEPIIRLDERIQAVWQETPPSGYNIELQIPLSMLGHKLTFAVADVDDPATRNLEFFLTTTESNRLDEISTISITTPEIDKVLNRILRESSRIWLLNKNAGVIASAGNLTNNNPNVDEEPFMDISFKQVMVGLVRLFYQMLLTQPVTEFQDDLSNVSRLSGDEITSALTGHAATKWRQTPDARVNILTATYPIYEHNKIAGAVAVEETSNSVLILQNKAIEILINVSVLGFIFAMFILLGFATYLSIRIRRLRDNAEEAIGEDGRVTGVVMKSAAGDEIGDLTRSFANMLDRLANYNRYLETMASKLSHELRTPITVVKSSLENLEHGNLDNHNVAYVERAREGIERLNGILTRMSEATRLEQTLQHEQTVEFDVVSVVSSCMKGYQLAKPEQSFKFVVESAQQSPCQLVIKGVPDLIAQMLDKLVSNAISFTKAGAPIIVTLQAHENTAALKVSNEGPLLPAEMQNALFDSMVSVRQRKGSEPHLGLGLYIVRLIVEFHNGQVSAKNRLDVEGVEFRVSLPLAH